jgi:carnitine 3-dehydrogenase
MQLEAAAPRSTIICSSSGGLTPSELQAEMTAPERLVIAHPFNPAHLIPLVEIIGGKHTSPQTIDWTMTLMRRIGKKPIKLDREVTAYLANRLQFALLREAVHCLAEGVADARSIDDAVRYALAPRWLIMGALMTFSLAGGPGGQPWCASAHPGCACEAYHGRRRIGGRKECERLDFLPRSATG